ncbi:hypothetical protein [Desulfosporosinus nitroreducens]|uniref:DUF3887 domain-containing protein n=1 Tax=Desulfosporosinus nitroreducens TaxID=2018668 RepID=A0ABT8QXZ3_9FIRM|nr:hypothetical protein [Desulfosporosinus nitroreducens]MDO0824943.1 hypothetical protein [Desulfosporosinus nitroreducens]
MKKMLFSVKGLVLSVGLIGLSIFAISNYAFSNSPYLEKEFIVQKSVLNTFDLNEDEMSSYFMSDIFDKKLQKLSSNVNQKVLSAYSMLTNDDEIKIGDFKPMFFLKGNDTLLIGIKHEDGTISLTEFDISKEKPVKVKTQTKEGK